MGFKKLVCTFSLALPLFITSACVFNPKNYRREPANVPNTSSVYSNSNSFFEWPVDQARLTRGFLPQKRRPHLGVDLAAPRGTNVYAAHEGTVIYTGRGFSGFGKMVMIQSSGNTRDAWATVYAHLSKINVKQGDRVNTDTILGAIGNTGRSRGNHLHFEIRRRSGPVDPLEYLPKQMTASHPYR